MDIQNAFNSVDRNAFFEALQIASGGLAFVLPFVNAFYGRSSPLYYACLRESVRQLLSRSAMLAISTITHISKLKNRIENEMGKDMS